MDPNGYEVNSTHIVGNGVAKYENNGRKVYDVTKRKWKKVFGGVLHNVFIGLS